MDASKLCNQSLAQEARGFWQRLTHLGIRDDLHSLRKPSLLRSLVATGTDWSLAVLAGALAFRWWWLMPVALVVVGNRQLAINNLLHEASHKNLASRRGWNDFLGQWLLAVPCLTSLKRYRTDHAAHHRFLGDPARDPDHFNRPSFASASWVQVWWKLVCDPSAWVSSVLGTLPKMTPREAGRLVGAWTVLLLGVALVVGPPFALAFGALWLAARATVFHALMQFREMADHFGLNPSSVMTYTRNVEGNRLLALLIHPRDDSFHLVHHLAPNVPFFSVRKAHGLLLQDAEYARQHHCHGYFIGTHSLVRCWEHRAEPPPVPDQCGFPPPATMCSTSTDTIDLRSDTVTRPTAAMRAAIASAPVGDDLYRDDPTVLELEAHCARLLGKEASIFMPTGTMSNQIALRCLTRPGDEVILDAAYHIHFYESAQSAGIAGVALNACSTAEGLLTVEDIERAWARKPRGPDYAVPRVICIENTVNAAGGRVFPLRTIRELRRFADDRGMAIHMDGARLWNAAVAAGVTPSEYCRDVDTVSVCFAKGLGAPAGSVLAGSAALIASARRYRKWYGGSMHQAGLLAAAALFALRHHMARLSDDHVNARHLAAGLARFDGVAVDVGAVETNIVMLDLAALGVGAAEFAELARAEDVLVVPWLPTIVRMVTHMHVGRAEVEEALRRLDRVLQALRRAA